MPATYITGENIVVGDGPGERRVGSPALAAGTWSGRSEATPWPVTRPRCGCLTPNWGSCGRGCARHAGRGRGHGRGTLGRPGPTEEPDLLAADITEFFRPLR